MNYTDDQLRALLALMLPETVEYRDGMLFWMRKGGLLNIHDTELLHLASLVEAGLTENLKCQYVVRLSTTDRENSPDWNMTFATWRARTRALAEVKGVTL